MNNSSCYRISPEKVFKGPNAWNESLSEIKNICKNPLILGRSSSTRSLRKKIENDLIKIGLKPKTFEIKYDCCEFDLENALSEATNNNSDAIISTGGGKVIDAGKLIADRLNIPSITVPLSAATCAGWTALSNIYTKDGSFIKDINLKTCPKLLVFDHNFIKKAPAKTLASGMADALAKWYEASLTSKNSSDGFVQQAVQMARVLRDQIFIDGYQAFNNSGSEEWVRVAEGCGLTAGLIGSIGGPLCRTAVAHPIHNGLTQLKFHEHNLHGEIVGLGIIIQLSIEEKYSDNKLAKQAKSQLINFLKKLSLPVTITELNLINHDIENLKIACEFTSLNSSEINQLGFNISSESLLEAIVETIPLGLIYN